MPDFSNEHCANTPLDLVQSCGNCTLMMLKLMTAWTLDAMVRLAGKNRIFGPRDVFRKRCTMNTVHGPQVEWGMLPLQSLAHSFFLKIVQCVTRKHSTIQKKRWCHWGITFKLFAQQYQGLIFFFFFSVGFCYIRKDFSDDTISNCYISLYKLSAVQWNLFIYTKNKDSKVEMTSQLVSCQCIQ